MWRKAFKINETGNPVASDRFLLLFSSWQMKLKAAAMGRHSAQTMSSVRPTAWMLIKCMCVTCLLPKQKVLWLTQNWYKKTMEKRRKKWDVFAWHWKYFRCLIRLSSHFSALYPSPESMEKAELITSVREIWAALISWVCIVRSGLCFFFFSSPAQRAVNNLHIRICWMHVNGSCSNWI